jgi:amino acid adenylation domain-containing protein
MIQLNKSQTLLLTRFNTGPTEYKMSMPLQGFFEHQASITPDAIAVTWRGKSLSYEQVNQSANRLAAWLKEQGTGQGNMVGICATRSFDLVIGILGILKSGAAYVPFDAAYPAERIKYMVQQSGVQILLCHSEFERIFIDTGVKTRVIDDLENGLKDYNESNPGVKSKPDDPAYVLFTSGSTGQPKGVVMIHRALANLIEWHQKNKFLGVSSRTLQFAPVSFDVSFQELFTTWSTGGTLVLIDEDLRLNAIHLLEFITVHKIDRLFLPFIALQHLAEVAQNSRIWPVCLQDVITAGEQLQITGAIRSLFENIPHARLHNHYGPTETHVVTSFLMEGDVSLWPDLPPIGKPVSNTHVYLLDEKMMPVELGEQGSIYVTGAALAKGYINRDDLTSERFVRVPFKGMESMQMYHTGDLGRYRDDGNIEYLGRADNQVKVRGYRIELGEVEVTLAGLTGVKQAAVTVREDVPGDKRLVAYLVADENTLHNSSLIRKQLAGHLPDYMIPSSVVFLNELPRTPSGKIDRRSLPAPSTNRPDSDIPYIPPSLTIEKNIASVWSGLLKIDQVGVEDSFFEMGGNSLLALQSIARLKQEFDIEIPVVMLYRYPTIRALTHALENGNGSNPVQKARDRQEERMRNQNTTSRNVEDGIAIIGMSGCFPGAENVNVFWENLLQGKETTKFFTDAELDPFIDPLLKTDPLYVKARGVLKDASGFDASFFQINPRLAELMDPQQRIFLELCWAALEHAGHTSAGYDGTIGVFAGCGNNTYYLNNVLAHKDAIERVGAFQVMVANEKDYIATRVSHAMNLTGPSVSIHTACSTSLTAVAMGCQALRDFQCDMALAGGIAITSPVNSGHLYQEGGMFSADGHTRPFDAGATGTVFSDGAGVVVLKRYNDAVRDGNTIYAVIRGVGVNNDGAGKASFTAPSVEGQAMAIAMAHSDAGVSADTISFVETHGTATPLGDPIEVEALSLVFRNESSRKQYCALGSLKSNIGHLTAAAGVAGLIKTVFSLYHKILPASLNYNQPNPSIDFPNSPFYVNYRQQKWERGEGPRRAGISSFGVGGTNVHLVLEEAPEQPTSISLADRHLIMLSAKSDVALKSANEQLLRFLDHHPEVNLADLAYTLQTGRESFRFRKFVVAGTIEEVKTLLASGNPLQAASGDVTTMASGIAFMFPGQGSQYVGMGNSFYRDEIVFRNSVDQCVRLFNPFLETDLMEVLYPAPGKESHSEELLKQTQYTQPALFTVGYALAQLWISWGVQPSALIGHSIGEFCAACIAGIMSLEDATLLVANRGKMMQALPSGSMLSVRAPANDVLDLVPASCSLAAVNGPSLCVISGPHEEIEKLAAKFEKDEIVARKLFTSHAFHSPMMDPIVEPFRLLVEKVKLNKPQIPVISTSTAKLLSNEEATDPHYWSSHLRKPVLFADGIRELWNQYPDYVLIEAGPRNTATLLARQQASDPKKQIAIPSLPDKPGSEFEWTTLWYAVGRLWLSGTDVNWKNIYAKVTRKRIPLPTYPFQHQRYWVDPVTPSSGMNTFHAYRPFDIDLNLAGSTPVALPVSQTIISDNMTNVNRKTVLIAELKSVMEEASGIDLSGADPSFGFMELGLDSLFLTQAALTISKKYGTKITFRQLNESLTSIDSLAAHLDQVLPAAAVSTPLAVPVAGVVQPASGAVVPQGNLQWLIMQQMQIMQQQLAAMQTTGISPSLNTSVTPQSNPAEITATALPKQVAENEKAELEKPFGAIARIEKTSRTGMTPEQKQWLEQFIRDYNKRTAKSKSYTQTHRAHLADPRVVTGFKPELKELIYQAVVDKSKGCRMWDIDGNEYIDVLNGFGSNFLGYNSPVIMKAVEEQLKNGYELGPQHPLAGEMTRLICEFTGYDRAGLCNTGSEAVLGAMRIARTVTGRNLIVCFNGSYHGINDEVIVRGTRKLQSFPAAAGIPRESVQNMLVLDYGTDEALEIIRSRAGELAAVMIEPIQSRRADFTPREFIHEVRKITSENGCLLIFDEVITGFRLLPGGAQEFYNVKADVSTYGKVIGGGMPIGAIAGRKEYMDALDGGFWKFGDDSVPEAGVTYFAGTFVRHPLALAAGTAVLHHLKERGKAIYDKLNGNTTHLVNKVNEYCSESGALYHLVSFGSLFKVKWDEEQPYGELLFLLLRHKGIHIYDGFPCFVTDAFTDEDIETVINSFVEVTNELQQMGFLPSKLHSQSPRSNGQNGFSPDHPPVPGARLGKDAGGNPAWFVADPDRPGKFRQVTG